MDCILGNNLIRVFMREFTQALNHFKKITATVRKYTFDLGNNLRRVFMREFIQALNHSHVRYATNHSEQQHSEGCTYSDIPR